MTILFDFDFSAYSTGTELQEIAPEWVLSGSPRLGVRSTGRLSHTVYTGGSYKYHRPGPVRWSIDVFAGDPTNGGPAWYFGVGNSGVSDTAGAYVQYNFAAQQWRITEGYTVRGSVADDWHTLGAARRLILDWAPAAKTLSLTVVDGGVEVGSSTVTGITPDGDYLFLAARWNDEAYHTITLSAMSATDGAVESTLLPFKAYVSGTWVTGTFKCYTDGAWIPGQLKRFNGTSWD
jgi:hypothetical protein